MATFQVSLVSPEKLLFSKQVDQVDLPGAEGDFGVLAGHAAIVAMLRPGIVTIISGTVRDRFVVEMETISTRHAQRCGSLPRP
jgi:F-type H+-transporting ATPase subunit epsilon